MEPWVIGLIALSVVGLAVILFGALHDRRLNRRRAAEMLAPPPRNIPQFPADAPAPRYLSELQASRPPASGADNRLSPQQRDTISSQLTLEQTLTIPLGYASPDFVTDPETGWAVLAQPAVLVCADPVTSIRELLPVLERLLAADRPLALLAPALADDVRRTLAVNVIQRKLRALAVVGEPSHLATVAEAVGATPISRDDRQAGWFDPGWLGETACWVSTRTQSYLLDPGAA